MRRRGVRVAEGAPLLREYRVCSSIEGSNPSLSTIYYINHLIVVFLCLNFNTNTKLDGETLDRVRQNVWNILGRCKRRTAIDYMDESKSIPLSPLYARYKPLNCGFLCLKFIKIKQIVTRYDLVHYY